MQRFGAHPIIMRPPGATKALSLDGGSLGAGPGWIAHEHGVCEQTGQVWRSICM